MRTTLPLALSSLAFCCAHLAAQEPRTISWPPGLPPVVAARLACGDFLADQRPSTLVLTTGQKLFYSYHTAVHVGIFEIPLNGLAAGDVVVMPDPAGDRFLLTGNGAAREGWFEPDGDVLLESVLDATWVGAHSLRCRVDAAGGRWVAGIQQGTDGKSVCIAYKAADGVLAAFPPITMPASVLGLALAEFEGGGAPEVVAVSARALRVYRQSGLLVYTQPWTAVDPWVVAVDGTPIGSGFAVVDRAAGHYQATVVSSTAVLAVTLDETGLQLAAPLDVNGLAAVDSDGDRLDDDLLVTHAEGHTALRIADPGPGATQAALATIPSQPGAYLCVHNLDEDEDDDFVGWTAAGELAYVPNVEGYAALSTTSAVVEAEYFGGAGILQLTLNADALTGYDRVDVRVWHQPNPVTPTVPPGLQGTPVWTETELIENLPSTTFGQGGLGRLLDLGGIVGTETPELQPDAWLSHDHYWIEVRYLTPAGDASATELEVMTQADGVVPSAQWDDYMEVLEAANPAAPKKPIGGRPGVVPGLILITVLPPPQLIDPPSPN